MTSPIPPTGPVPYEPPAPPPSPKPWQRKPVLIAAAALAAVLVIVVVLLATGVFGGGTMTVHGSFQVAGNPLQSGQNYPDISDGTQVVVTDPSGKVIGTSSLSFDAKATSVLNKTLGSLSHLAGETIYDFTVTVPAGEPRYGITVGHRGTIWFTPQEMSKGPGLSLGT